LRRDSATSRATWPGQARGLHQRARARLSGRAPACAGARTLERAQAASRSTAVATPLACPSLRLSPSAEGQPLEQRRAEGTVQKQPRHHARPRGLRDGRCPGATALEQAAPERPRHRAETPMTRNRHAKRGVTRRLYAGQSRIARPVYRLRTSSGSQRETAALSHPVSPSRSHPGDGSGRHHLRRGRTPSPQAARGRPDGCGSCPGVRSALSSSRPRRCG